jgi:hypothetical protein
METFVVRVWQSADPGADVGLHGTVEHVRTATTRAFTDAEQLLAILDAERGSGDTR